MDLGTFLAGTRTAEYITHFQDPASQDWVTGVAVVDLEGPRGVVSVSTDALHLLNQEGPLEGAALMASMLKDDFRVEYLGLYAQLFYLDPLRDVGLQTLDDVKDVHVTRVSEILDFAARLERPGFTHFPLWTMLRITQAYDFRRPSVPKGDAEKIDYFYPRI